MVTFADPPPLTIEELVHRFVTGTLDAEHWSHPAHLFACRHILATSETTAVAVDRLRTLIEAHNARVGVRPGHRGYHETITRYFVEAMAHTNPPTIAALLSEPALRCEAPERHWSPEVLASAEAAHAWVPPDREPLPWAPVA